MKNENNYEKTRKILEDNIIRLMIEKNLTARALSIRIEKNEWYITRMLNGNIDPSLQVISKIAEILRVSAADLFSKNDGWKNYGTCQVPLCQNLLQWINSLCYTAYTKLIVMKECFKMINESCRSKRRCLLSSLQGSSPLVRIAEYRKRTKKCTASYSAVIKLSFGESNEEKHS